ncbi:MAG TPA: FKBP-type peptidyl-prolyl cis-trans isomerase [Pyrinomonadaceae bacterium]|nr:FKBP-type peptidyl-prolyl cis-trans isomerase [Pyrinomonadaceae bacterium]
MPESRHRKTNKARKRARGSYPATNVGRPAGKNRRLRTIAIVVVVALAASAIAYVLANRGKGGSAGTEVTTASGLRYTDIVEGTGPVPQRGQTLSIHYTGTLESGRKFDSSYDRGTPMTFQLGVSPMIKGWDEGVSTMKVGGKRRLVVPAALGYGAAGRPPNIPPNSTLVFELELLSAK